MRRAASAEKDLEASKAAVEASRAELADFKKKTTAEVGSLVRRSPRPQVGCLYIYKRAFAEYRVITFATMLLPSVALETVQVVHHPNPVSM